MSHKKHKKDFTKARCTFFCCHGGDCAKHGARETEKALRHAVKSCGLRDETYFLELRCTGQCKHGPIVLVSAPDGLTWYAKLRAKDAARVVQEHLESGQPLEEKRLHGKGEETLPVVTPPGD
jgi:(2Fe-2S) ferredoxin